MEYLEDTDLLIREHSAAGFLSGPVRCEENGGAMLELGSPAGDVRTDEVYSSKAWYALRVRARSEQMIAEALAIREVECFAPFWQERRVYTDRVRRLPVAVFPGYIFCRVGPPERVRVYSTPGVQCLVGAGRVPEVIEEHVIAGLQKRSTAESGQAVQSPRFRISSISMHRIPAEPKYPSPGRGWHC